MRIHRQFHRILCLSLFVAISGVLLFFNTKVQEGGVVDQDTLSDTSHFLNKMKRELDALGINDEGAFVFVYKISQNASSKIVSKISQIHREISDVADDFEAVVVSVANVSGFRDIDDVITPVNYISEVENVGFDEWKFRIVQEKGLSAIVDPELEHVIFLVYPPAGYNRMQFYRAMVQYVEARKISSFEWFFKKDIEPVDSNFELVGWDFGRGSISSAPKVDAFILTGVGMILAFGALLWYTRMLIASGVAAFLLGCAFVWMRGEIGLLYFFGVPMYERVYTLLAYTPNLVQGVSFFVQVITSYKKNKHLSPQEAWSVGCKSIAHSVIVVALIAGCGFLNLMTFPVSILKEVGFISFVGIFNLLFFTFLTLPILHMILLRWDKEIPLNNLGLDVWFDKVVKWCDYVTRTLTARSVYLFILLMLTICCWGISQGFLKKGGMPIKYIERVKVGKSAKYMNKKGGGNVALEFYISSKEKEGEIINDPNFTGKVYDFLKDVRKIEGVRNVYSILDSLEQISIQSFDRPFPDSSQLFAYAFMFINSSLDSEVKSQYYDEFAGYRITITTDLEDTVEWLRICDTVLFKLAGQYPMLNVFGMGDLVRYVYVDQLIVNGMSLNIVMDIIMVACLVAFFVHFYSDARFRSVKLSIQMGLVTIIPFIFAFVSLAIVMMVFGISLEISTALIAPITIAASADFASYLTFKVVSRMNKAVSKMNVSVSGDVIVSEALRYKGGDILADGFTNKALFAPLFFSMFIPIQNIGWMLIVVLFFALVGTLILMSPVLRLVVMNVEVK